MEIKKNTFLKRMELFLKTLKEVYGERGIYYFLRTSIIFFYNMPFYCHHIIFRPKKTFIFRKESYDYFYHLYNMTWRNERIVEIPIIWKIVEKYRGKKILEVGDVLSHYFSVNYDLADKYSKTDGIIQQDVVDYKPATKYDLIVSISTLEHVGWDENLHEPMKVMRAIENLKSLLSKKGKMVVSIPLGYNQDMDKLLKENKIKFTKQYYLKRISKDNKWIEINQDDAFTIKYGTPFCNANGLIIGIISNVN